MLHGGGVVDQDHEPGHQLAGVELPVADGQADGAGPIEVVDEDMVEHVPPPVTDIDADRAVPGARAVDDQVGYGAGLGGVLLRAGGGRVMRVDAGDTAAAHYIDSGAGARTDQVDLRWLGDL